MVKIFNFKIQRNHKLSRKLSRLPGTGPHVSGNTLARRSVRPRCTTPSPISPWRPRACRNDRYVGARTHASLRILLSAPAGRYTRPVPMITTANVPRWTCVPRPEKNTARPCVILPPIGVSQPLSRRPPDAMELPSDDDADCPLFDPSSLAAARQRSTLKFDGDGDKYRLRPLRSADFARGT